MEYPGYWDLLTASLYESEPMMAAGQRDNLAGGRPAKKHLS
jgi:hypothetical protein